MILVCGFEVLAPSRIDFREVDVLENYSLLSRLLLLRRCFDRCFGSHGRRCFSLCSGIRSLLSFHCGFGFFGHGTTLLGGCFCFNRCFNRNRDDRNRCFSLLRGIRSLLGLHCGFSFFGHGSTLLGGRICFCLNRCWNRDNWNSNVSGFDFGFGEQFIHEELNEVVTRFNGGLWIVVVEERVLLGDFDD